MSTGSYRILADENVERKAKRHMEKRGHDVEMVVDVLGPGTDDDEIEAYAAATNRVILSGDQDFLARECPTLFVEDGEMSAFDLAEIVDAVAEAMTQDQLDETRGTKLVEDWLE